MRDKGGKFDIPDEQDLNKRIKILVDIMFKKIYHAKKIELRLRYNYKINKKIFSKNYQCFLAADSYIFQLV